MMVMIKNIGYKLLLPFICIMAVVYYDITVPLINGIIQLKINILGFFLEPLLQWAFDVSIRQAQIISAWIYLLIAIFLFGYFLIKISQSLLASIYTARRSWLALTKWQQSGFIVFFTLLFIAIGKIVLLVI
jgi:hypothetical protein